MLIFDLFCYLALLGLLLYLTRVSPLFRVTVRHGDLKLNGTILQAANQLSCRVGLLNTPTLAPGDGLMLVGVKKVHTKGMHFPIDLIFLDDSNRVLELRPNMDPGQKSICGPKGTKSTLELGAGTLKDFPVALYGKLEITAVNKNGVHS
jgi:uncharacterized membrane protein (UPF0127 family)